MSASASAKSALLSSAAYPSVEANPDFAKLEEQALAHWKKEGTFEASITQRPATKDGANNEFIFYDGPPFANGLPHYGHLLTGYVKDMFARYQTMKGKRVERRFGWDCHGLPAEMGAEKELGISGRQQITNFGIGKFNAHCQTSVMKYAHEWEHYVTRQARWVDFANDYKTMNKDYMESVLWAFKQLYEKGLIFESHRVMPYSWAAETPLSNFETKLDNSYRDRTDKAITVAFELDAKPAGAPDADKYFVLAWTTTPWTLPSNLALAVSKNVEYSVYLEKGECFIFASSSAAKYEPIVCKSGITKQDENGNGLEGYAVSTVLPASSLIGLTYKPLFPYFADKKSEGVFRILDGSSFIEEGSGTGVVHMAPGFGEDDQRVCKENGIDVVVPVDESGRYTSEIFDLPAAASEVQGAILSTQRLYLKPFAAADYEKYKALQSDEKVAATTSDGLLPEEKIRAEFERFLSDQTAKGFTQWAVYRREDDAFIGRAGLDNRDYDQFNTSGKPCVELRYAFLSDFWGKGYATEVSVALLDWAMANTKAEIIIAGCNPTYDAAVKVLKKLGFESHQHVPFRNQTVWYHTLIPADWQKTRASLITPPLSLQGLNVIAQIQGQTDDEPYKADQVAKYGLANLRIINWLKLTGKLVAQDDYKHNYPHCWRTDTPLIYRALPSWYVKVTAIRDRAVELNQQINWIPEHIKDGQMGHMLATAPDWSISRNRFWGTPIPVWRAPSGKIKVFGSIAEIEAASGQKITDLHRPYIDEIVVHEGGEEYRRVTDVFDCWFESGSMPFAQVHYPFENKEWFETHFPADFITEYVGQTRGWFNTLIILATALFDKPPFKNCICHGVVLDAETGLKYSKRLKNYKDPLEVIDQFGADALRWLMISSPVMRGQDLMVDPDGKFIRDAVRLHIKPIWNAYNFFTLYANADGVKAKEITSATALLDQYILAKLKSAVEAIESALDAYDTMTACNAVDGFFDVLNNWYIRRTRERFWASTEGGVTEDKQAAYDTLYTALSVMTRAAAPLLPLVTDEIYRGLTGGDSVHLATFPDVSGIKLELAQANIMHAMDITRSICSAGLFIRSKENIRTRQPLSAITLYHSVENESYKMLLNKEYQDLILDELNVKKFSISNELNNIADQNLIVNAKSIGAKYGNKTKEIIAASKKGEWKLLDSSGGYPSKVEVAGVVLETKFEGGQFVKDDFDIRLTPKGTINGAQALSSQDALVVLDLNITDELKAEGYARDVVRMVQQARKDADFHVSDEIALTLDVPAELQAMLAPFGAFIQDQTLAKALTFGAPTAGAFSATTPLEEFSVTVGVQKR